jgi:hypothetical protein
MQIVRTSPLGGKVPIHPGLAIAAPSNGSRLLTAARPAEEPDEAHRD